MADADKAMNQASKSIRLGEIAARVGCPAPAEDIAITGVASLEEAGPTELTFVGSDAFVKRFKGTRAGAVLVQKNIKLPQIAKTVVLQVEDTNLAMAVVLQMFAHPVPRPPAGIDKQARVDASAKLGEQVSVGAFCFVGRNAQIGKGSVLHPQVYIGDDVQIGADCEIFPQVTIRERVTIGARVCIHAGSVVGSDGFGYSWDGKRHAKIPQIGSVVIEDDVEIGSCVCIDRAKFAVTRIGRGTKIDNLVQIAHNVIVGPNCIIAGQAGVAGSTTLGSGVVLGGQAAVKDHIVLNDGAVVAARGAVADDIPAKTVVSGMPALPHRQSLREQAALRRLPDMVVQIRKLQEEIDQLKEEIQKQRKD